MLDYGPRFLGRVGIAPQAPLFVQRRLGAVDPEMRAVLARIKADSDAVNRIYQRNAAIPLQFPHVTREWQAAADISDRLLSKVYVPYQQNPDNPLWSQPTSPQGLATLTNSLDDLEARIDDMNRNLTKYEAQTKITPPAAPGAAPVAAPGVGAGQVIGIAAATAAVLVALGEITGVTNIFGMRR